MIKKFSLPGFYHTFDIIVSFLKYRQEHIEYFYEDRIIESIYEIVSLLIHSKQKGIFSNSLILISSIIKTIYKSNNYEQMAKIINDNNM